MRLITLLIIIIVSACSQATDPITGPIEATTNQPAATAIYHGGPIYTAIDATPTVEAVAVLDQKILATGTLEDLAPFTSPSTLLINLDGAAMYPGFTDAHAHLVGIGFRELTLNLEGTPSVAALVKIVGEEIDKLDPGITLYGRGWIETGWPEARFPNRDDLDAVSPDNPVILERADGHASVANSAALRKAGITHDTPNPNGGRIEKDASGSPTGMLIDTAQSLVASLLSTPNTDQKRQAYEVGASVYAAYGWTGLHNMSVDPDDIDLILTLASSEDTSEPKSKQARIPIRVYNSLEPSGLSRLEKEGPLNDSSGRIITRAIKLYADGALGSRGAFLFEPYTDQPGTRGLQLLSRNDALAYFGRALNAKIQVNTHAIGDNGNAYILDWYETAFAKSGISKDSDPRFRIEHSQIVRPQDIARFANLGMIASMQPSHAIGDLHFAPDRLGDDRLNGAYAWRSMIDAGVIVAAGSDAPVERGDPRIEFYAAIARRDLEGFQAANWHPEEAVTRQEALKMLTIWPAYASFQEETLGTIEPGKRADFTVFSEDIMTIEPENIISVKTIMTIVDGQIIYKSDNQ